MHIETPPAGLRLAPHVRACECDDQIILLDLRNSRYLGVSRSTSDALAGHVAGWPASSVSTGQRPSPAAISSLTQRLIAQSLLIENSPDALFQAASSPVIDLPTTSLDIDDRVNQQTIGARRVARLLRSAAATSWCLRHRSLQSIAQSVDLRRRHLKGTDDGPLDAMISSTAVYERLRPFIFTARARCLHDSLTLVGFLAAEGTFPRWVIGVKTAPFGAHSWVQSGKVVLNDQHEYVRRFRPILAV